MIRFGSIKVAPNKIEISADDATVAHLYNQDRLIGCMPCNPARLGIQDIFERSRSQLKDAQQPTLNVANRMLLRMEHEAKPEIRGFFALLKYAFTGTLDAESHLSADNTEVDYGVRLDPQTGDMKSIVLFTPKMVRQTSKKSRTNH